VGEELRDRALGEFQLVELLGEGAFGSVYRAHQAKLARDAVIKILRPEISASAGAVDRFLQEARLASRLDHPFAAHVYAFGAEPDGVLWIAMELVRGTPLDRVLEHGALPLERAAPFLRRLCEVVQTAHDQGIVHRDLKPSNVMVISRAGSVFPKLIDLGIAMDQAQVGLDGGDGKRGAVGTPFYMAPEQWVNASRAGPPADIYALGAITYEVLTGKPPFDGESVLAVAIKHAKSAPPALPDGFPAPLSAAIARAMAKRAAQRFASALELGNAIVEASGAGADDVPIPALPEAIRAQVMLRAPQPIAETTAVLDAARNPHQALLGLRQATRAIAQYVGVVALACRTRSGAGRRSDPEAVHELLGALRRGRLEPDAWWRLARELCRAFASIPDAHPIPELVGVFFADGAARATAMEAVLAAAGDVDLGAANAERVRAALADALPRLATALAELAFLDDYQLVVPGANGANGGSVWMGVRRPQRTELALEGTLVAGQPLLAGGDGRPVVALWPLAQVAAPSPGAAPELFLLDGAGRAGASLVAPPHGFERHDDDVWDWLGERLGAIDAGDAGARVEETSPYRGLSTFQERDADAFLGREPEVESFVNRLRTTPLIAVVGPSGVGKSSFVRAGVLPALGRGAPVRTVTVRPGAAPLAALAVQLRAVGLEADAAALAADPAGAGEAVRAWAAHAARDVVIVVDQLEELFTLCRDPHERAAYGRVLAGCARAADDPVRVIATVRDDFLVRASTLPAIGDRLAASLQLLATPVPDALRRILVEPARRAGYTFEDDALLAEMIEDVIERPGALALLSFTAFQLWELRDRHFRRLPRKAYQALGGVGGALGRHAEQTLTAMSLEQQRLTRVAFRSLVTAEGTRAVLARDDLQTALAGAASGAGVAQRTIEALVEARLLVVSEGERGEQRVEIAHEALLGAWPRLLDWRREDADGVRFRDQLRASAKQWDERGRPAGLLWRGDALLEYQLWRQRFPDALAAVDEAFARASEAEASRSRRVRRVIVGVIVVAMAIVSVVLLRLNRRATIAAADSRERLRTSLVERGRRALLDENPAEAAVYLGEAYAHGADTVALRYLLGRAATLTGAFDREIETGKPVAPRALALAGNDTIVAGVGNAIVTWDAATGTERGRVATPVPVTEIVVDDAGVRGVAIPASADGKGALLFAVAGGAPVVVSADLLAQQPRFSRDGTRFVLLSQPTSTITVWDAQTAARVAIVTMKQPISTAALSAAGDKIAGVTADRHIRVWDVASGAEVAAQPLDEPPGGPVFVSPTQVLTWEATGRCAAVIWDMGGGNAPPIVMAGHRQTILTADVSRDGTRVVTGSRDRTVKVWDAATGRLVVDLEGHRGLIQAVAFDGSGTRVLSLSADRTARVWDASTGTELAVMAQPDMRQAVIARDARHVVTASGARLAVWPVRRAELVHSLADAETIPISAAFSPDQKWIATEDRRQIVRLWNRADGALVRTHAEHDLGEESLARWGGNLRLQRKLVAIDPASTRVAAPVGNTVAIWDLATGAAVGTLEGHTELVTSARFAPDGAHLVTAAQDGAVIVWDARTRAAIATLRGDGDPEDPKPLWDAEVSPDGELVLAAGAAGGYLWRWRTGELVRRLEVEDDLQSAGFSASGDRVAGGGASGRLRVWSVASGEVVSTLDTGSRNLRAVRFVGDALLVTTGGDGLTRVWDVAGQVELARFGLGGLGSEGGGIERWVEVAPDGSALAASGADRITRVWRLAMETRPPAEVAAWVRCRVPLELVDERIVPRATPPPGCQR
jgi:WD40 repeat protein